MGSGSLGQTVERNSEGWEGGMGDPKSQDAFLEVPTSSVTEIVTAALTEHWIAEAQRAPE